MAQEPSVALLYEIGLLIVVSSLASELFKRFRLPGLIGAILAGLFIGGPGGLGLIKDLTVVNILAILGATLILFMAGVEFESSAFWNAGRRAFLITTIGVATSVLVGYAVGKFLGWSDHASFLLGVVIAPSGTSVIAASLSATGKLRTAAGSTLLTACIVDDVESVLLLSIALGSVSTNSFATMDLAWTVAIATLFILTSIYIGGKLMPLLIAKSGRLLSDEVLFATLLGLGLMLSFVSTQVGLAAITGAFIAGAIIPTRKIGERIIHRLSTMKEIFAAIFFTSVGLSIDPFTIPGVLPTALLVLGLAIIARFLGGALGGTFAGIRGRLLAAMAVALAVRGEMSLIIAREGVNAGIVGSEFLAITAAMVIGSMLLALPILSKLSKSLS